MNYLTPEKIRAKYGEDGLSFPVETAISFTLHADPDLRSTIVGNRLVKEIFRLRARCEELEGKIK